MSSTKYVYYQITKKCVKNKDNNFFRQLNSSIQILDDSVVESSSLPNILNEVNKKNDASSPFLIKINRLIFMLEQDMDRGNFDFCGKESPYLYQHISSFFSKKITMLRELDEINRQYTKNLSEEKYKEWIINNQRNITEFLDCIDKIYACRSPCGKIKDFLFELADILIFISSCVGIAYLGIKLAPLAVSSAILSNTTQMEVMGGAGVLSTIATLVYGMFHTDRQNIEKSIKEEAKNNFKHIF